MYGNCRGYGETESPSRARPRRMQKSENLLLYYGVDLALEKSNPLTNRNEKGLFYSVSPEKFQIIFYFLFGLSKIIKKS